jgi:hypothetical protein
MVKKFAPQIRENQDAAGDRKSQPQQALRAMRSLRPDIPSRIGLRPRAGA